jgi:hypothetical protein
MTSQIASIKNVLSTALFMGLLTTMAPACNAQSGSRNQVQPQQFQARPVPAPALPSVLPAPAPALERRYRNPVQQDVRPARQPATFDTQPRATAQFGFENVDHRVWDSLLQKYVDRNGNVDYTTWQANRTDRSELFNYLKQMRSLDTSLRSSREAEMAYWINVYNALTIEGILRVFPTRSIKDHAPNAKGFNIWDDFKLRVGGKSYSLNDIEHKVLRPMGDARIHFAIVCASKGCPQLAQRAYVPELLDRQLNYSTELFFRSPDKFTYDLRQRQIGISPIIQWFAEDFGRDDQERMRYLSQFMPNDVAALAASGSATVNYLDYDWSLNLAPQGSTVQPATYFRPTSGGTQQEDCQGVCCEPCPHGYGN